MLTQSELPSVSIIILNYNGIVWVEKCLSSVLETKYPNFEVIFVDNASTDESLLWVEQHLGGDARVKIIKNAENVGYSAGNNIGFAHSSGDYIVFLNNDTVVDPEWLSRLVNAFTEDESIGLAQSFIINLTGETVQSAGWLYSDYLLSAYSVGAGSPVGTPFPPVFEVSFSVGAAMMISRKMVNSVGLFEPEVPFYYDDSLLSFKTWLSGKRVVTVSQSIVYHAGGDATKDNPTYFLIFNRLKARICLIFDIHYNYAALARALFLFAFSMANELVFNLLSKRSSSLSAQLKALSWGMRNFKFIWRNRLKHWSNAEITPQELLAKFVRVHLPNTGLNLLPSFYRKKYYTAKQY
jgi:GT2 family glycosyltransferase